jgi:K+-transporting ATPase ATPase C chain
MQLLHHLRVSIVCTLLLALICCGIYPAIVTGLAQALFHHKANGSLITRLGSSTTDENQAVGSALLGQPFSADKYFHPRPSAAGNGYDPTSSGGTNLGPTSAKLINGTIKRDDKGIEVVDFDGIRNRIVHYCVENRIPFESSAPLDTFKDAKGNLDDVKLIKAFNDDKSPLRFSPRQPIPPDAVTTSASGLDPHISPANAAIQCQRVAEARKMTTDQVKALVAKFTEAPDLGVFGEPVVNVLKLNIALDNR